MLPLRCALFAALGCPLLLAQGFPLALPQVTPFAGDPRLEPIPSSPIHVGDFVVFGEGKRLKLRFPPRVNGQNQSNGDGHADLYVFVDDYTGRPIPGQLPIVEAVPKGAAPNVTDLVARNYSAVWEIGIVSMGPNYDPNDPATRIDSFLKTISHPDVVAIYETNIHLNCPVLPTGSTVDPGTPPHEHAWFDGHEVTLAPYEIEDGISHPQVMFKFEDAQGHTLPSENAPHLVMSRIPGMPFYSSFWEVWTVVVPAGFPFQSLKSLHDVKGSGFPIRSTHVRLNCPVVAVEDAPDSGTYTQMPFENAFELVLNSYTGGIAHFDKNSFFVDVPEGQHVSFTRDGLGQPIGRTFAPTPFTKQRNFRITAIDLGGLVAAEPVPVGLGAFFPRVASIAGNFVPIVLQRPFATTPSVQWEQVSAPDSTGSRIRFTQRELERAYQSNTPPRLPPQIEQNITQFINNGLMDATWAPGVKPYVERLSLVGRALHEFVFRPEDGIQSIDTTSCIACHQTPTPGSGSRSLYNVVPRAGVLGDGPVLDTINAGSMWGSAAAELIVADRRARGLFATEPHASTGDRDSIRHFTSKAQNAHFGVQSSENVVEQTGMLLGLARSFDQDNDGIVEEATVGEITAQAAFLLALQAPSEFMEPQLMAANSITQPSVETGRRLFRQSITRGGIGCASCHTPFVPMPTTEFRLGNPETSFVLPIQAGHHLATALDVTEGYAAAVGQPGAKIYGDFKMHKMGRPMRSVGLNAPDVLKTAELWDVGSTAPYLRDGSAGMDLRQAVLRHGGITRTDVSIVRGAQTQLNSTQRQQTITITNTGSTTIFASNDEPIRIVLFGLMSPTTATAFNAHGLSCDGSRRQGAYWNVTQPLAPGASTTVQAVFNSPTNVTYSVLVQDFDGFSEAAAMTRAFLALRANDQKAVLDFLKVQTIQGAVGEGGLAPVGPELELPDGIGG